MKLAEHLQPGMTVSDVEGRADLDAAIARAGLWRCCGAESG